MKFITMGKYEPSLAYRKELYKWKDIKGYVGGLDTTVSWEGRPMRGVSKKKSIRGEISPKDPTSGRVGTKSVREGRLLNFRQLTKRTGMGETT